MKLSILILTAFLSLPALAGSPPFTLPAQGGNNGKVLGTDGAHASWVVNGLGAVTNVTASAPVTSSGGATPNIALPAATGSVDGYLGHLDWGTFNGKEPAIAAGSSAQYWRGDKTFQTLSTSVVPEGSNPYFTNARAQGAISAISPLTYSTGVVGCQTASGSQAGCLASADWSTFNAKQSTGYTPTTSSDWSWTTVPTTIQAALDSTANWIKNVASKLYALTDPGKIYISQSKGSDSNNCGIFSPCQTIQGGFNRIIANGDNSSVYYQIDIQPAVYAENVSLNDSHLVKFTVQGHNATVIAPSSGNALDSHATNTNLTTMVWHGVTFQGNVNLVGDSNGTGFLFTNGNWYECIFNGTTTVTTAGGYQIYNSQVNGNVALTNVISNVFSGGDGLAPAITKTITTNAGLNTPANWGGFTLSIVEKTVDGADTTCGASSHCQWREGARVGYSGGTITCSSTSCTAYDSYFLSAVTGTGTWLDKASMYASVPTGVTLSIAGIRLYSPATPGNWASTAPNNIPAALDRIAAALVAAGHTP